MSADVVTSSYSEYIVYVDESGDHGLETIDPEYPLFVLAFCIFQTSEYCDFLPAMHAMKFRHFGHDSVVLHERDIRKANGPFRILQNSDVRTAFMEDLSELVRRAPFTLIASVIRKDALTKRYTYPDSPYELGLRFCLERTHSFLTHREHAAGVTHVVAESRGRREDNALELQFRRICGGDNYDQEELAFRLELAHKQANSCGLQLADLCARPIGRHVLDPGQPNRAFDVLEEKFYRSGTGELEGKGLKCFP